MTSGAEMNAVALGAPEAPGASEAPEAPRVAAGIDETRAGAVVKAVPRAGRLKTAIGVVVTNGTGPVARPKRLP